MSVLTAKNGIGSLRNVQSIQQIEPKVILIVYEPEQYSFYSMPSLSGMNERVRLEYESEAECNEALDKAREYFIRRGEEKVKNKHRNQDGSPILPPTTEHRLGGYCGKCGAPYFLYSGPWMGVLPPPPEPTCACWNRPKITTATNTSGES